jgi:hypothetical protein
MCSCAMKFAEQAWKRGDQCHHAPRPKSAGNGIAHRSSPCGLDERSRTIFRGNALPDMNLINAPHTWDGPRRRRRRQVHLNSLISHEILTGTSMFSAAPISPEERCGTNGERMEQDTHLARLLSGAALPLALLAHRAGTTTADAGSIHHAQASIGLSALLLDAKLLVCGAAQCSAWLEREVVTREATSLP